MNLNNKNKMFRKLLYCKKIGGHFLTLFINNRSKNKLLYDEIKTRLKLENHKIIESTALEFFDRVVEGMNLLVEGIVDDAILIDETGNASFMIASKFPGIVAAQISDEHSAFMTKLHNNSKVLVLGSDVVAVPYGLKIVDRFLSAQFEGGRHLVRTDMLDKELSLCE